MILERDYFWISESIHCFLGKSHSLCLWVVQSHSQSHSHSAFPGISAGYRWFTGLLSSGHKYAYFDHVSYTAPMTDPLMGA